MINMKTGHFYLAQKRTFLLGVDIFIKAIITAIIIQIQTMIRMGTRQSMIFMFIRGDILTLIYQGKKMVTLFILLLQQQGL